MTTSIQIRRDTAANWSSYNPILLLGELGIETDSLKVKCGDGSARWNSLSYLQVGATGATGPAGPQGPGQNYLLATKSSDQVLSSNASGVATTIISDLSLSVEANTTYNVECCLIYEYANDLNSFENQNISLRPLSNADTPPLSFGMLYLRFFSEDVQYLSLQNTDLTGAGGISQSGAELTGTFLNLIQITGVFRTTAAGTYIQKFAATNVNGLAYRIKQNSYLKLEKVA